MKLIIIIHYSIVEGDSLHGVTLVAQKVAGLANYDASRVDKLRKKLCNNCKCLLEHVIKGKIENFPR